MSTPCKIPPYLLLLILMDQDTDTLEVLESLPPVKCNRPLDTVIVAQLLSKGYTLTKIASLFGVSVQAVSEYCIRHKEKLDVLKDHASVISSKLKSQVVRILDNLEETDLQKVGFKDKWIGLGIGIEKYRLIDGQSTSNVSSWVHMLHQAESKDIPQVVVEPDNE